MTRNPSSRWLIAVMVSAMLILVTGGVWFYRTQQHELQQQAEGELQAVAQLKVEQIVAWRAERLGDATLLTESPILVNAVSRWMANPQADNAEELLAQFRAMQAHYQYYNILLVDVDGNERLDLRGDPRPLHPEAADALAVALRDHQPVLTDLHSGLDDLSPHIDAIAPLFANEGPSAEAVGAIILQSDASQFLGTGDRKGGIIREA